MSVFTYIMFLIAAPFVLATFLGLAVAAIIWLLADDEQHDWEV